MKRSIPEGYEYDPKSIKPLAKMLWSMSVALGHALTANRQFTRLKSATISPDGMVGGQGYVMSIKDIRKALYDACEAMSALCDTVHDEINAAHWKPKLAELEKQDISDIQHLLGDAETILEDPEGNAEEMAEDEEEGKNKGAPWHHPAVLKNEKTKKDPKSGMPDAGDKETLPSQGAHPAGATHNNQTKQASASPVAQRVLGRFLRSNPALLARFLQANSSLPVETMPGGPRVDHLDRGDSDQTGPFGSYNQGEDPGIHDQWTRDQGVGGEYNYPADWSGNFSQKSAGSAIPDAATEPTPTQAFDFGIGMGDGDQATGQAAGGYGNANPGTPGVYGPQSGLPKDPLAPRHDRAESDSISRIESESGGHTLPSSIKAASYDRRYGTAVLPQDVGPKDVARADYYTGPKSDNMQNTTVGATGLPGEQLPSKDTPLSVRPAHLGEHMFATGMPEDLGEHMATGELPGDQNVNYHFDKGLSPNTSYRYEQMNQPYIKWDSTTHQQRPDPTYQRDPIQGPYVKPETVRPSDG
jgi:hypothetical protein